MTPEPLKKVVLLGGGSHCRVVLDVLNNAGGYQVCGITDLKERKGSIVLGDHQISHVDSDLEALLPEINYAFVGVGDDLALRRRLFEMAKGIGYEIPVLISPRSYLSTHTRIGEGTLVGHQATVNPLASIGLDVIVNTGAIIEHDCQIGDHSHIASRAVLCGGVQVGDMTLIGAGSVVIPGLTIGSNVLIGAGSVVINDVPDNVLAVGNPARIIRSR